MADFKPFAAAIRRQFAEMSQEPLFEVNSDRDATWAHYLASFPAGTDPIYRTRTEHDCSCCRSFIRNVGAVVAIQNGAISTIWDVAGIPEPYQTVADAMAVYVRNHAIGDIFLTEFPKIGAEISRELTDAGLITYDHFSLDIPRTFVSKDGDSLRGKARTAHALFLRGLTTLRSDCFDTIIELINAKKDPLYRGKEFEPALIAFRQLQQRFLALPEEGPARDNFAWLNLNNRAALFRNTVMGTLAEDLSKGDDIDAAVGKFEYKMDPNRFKRSSSVITESMVKSTMKTIAELDLEPSLERRHAQFEDVSVNSVLFVDNSVRGKMRDSGGLHSLLMEEVRPAKFDPDAAEKISIEDFVAKVLPKTTSLKLWLADELLPNFVSLTAPVNEDCVPLFKWGNNFAWSYDGNVADSIKDRVKRAGGQVEGVTMRVSLAWTNKDDLDIHVHEPNGNHIHFSNKGDKNRGGYLDIDMNAHGAFVRDAVENIRWINRPKDGLYRVEVHNYAHRESIDIGFTIEIESGRGLHTLRFEKPVRNKALIHVADITVRNGEIEKIAPAKDILGGAMSRDHWGLKTMSLVPVDSLVLSPNYWDDNAVGNKHWFFVLDKCRNPEPTRGIYNEFLHPRLEPHRKVFEILGDKTKCPVADNQMSGLGFSSTRQNKVTVQAMGPNLTKSYTIAF